MIAVNMTDTEFAAHLAKQNALHTPHHVGKSVMWYAPDGACVAVAIYDNADSTRKLFIAT